MLVTNEGSIIICDSGVYAHIRPLLVVKVFLVTSELTKACGRAVIIIHYSIISPQHILYNLNICWTNHRQDVDVNLGN